MFLKDHRFYMCTLSPAVWYDAPQREAIIEWFSRHDQVLGYQEQEGQTHWHVLFSSKQKKTGNVTRAIENLHTDLNIEWTKGVTINVKYSSVPLGHFHYLTDEIKGGKRVMLKGWRMSWIQEQCRANLKSKPRKLLRKDVYVVNNIEGPDLIVQYATKHHMPLVDKRTFVQVVVRMGRDKYRFHKTKKKDLFADTLSIMGHDRASVSLWENELMFVDA